MACFKIGGLKKCCFSIKNNKDLLNNIKIINFVFISNILKNIIYFFSIKKKSPFLTKKLGLKKKGKIW